MSIEETAQWIDSMFDHVPVQFYFAEIEDSKHKTRRFAVEHDDLAVDATEIEKKGLSVEGRMTVSQYNAALLIEKKDQVAESVKPLMEDDDEELAKNPTAAIRERFNKKMEEVRKGKPRPSSRKPEAKGEKTSLPLTKKHPKRSEKKPQHVKRDEKIESFKRPTMTSPELKDNLDFGTVTLTSGKTVPKYLNKKRHD